jgi:hypothetical protein
VTLGRFRGLRDLRATGASTGRRNGARRREWCRWSRTDSISGALFFCIGVLYDRMHSRQIADYGGVVNTMPDVRRIRRAVRDGQLRVCRARRDSSASFS